ncbi:MAG TPA: tetratricopeptide repeat protein [Bacteroidales bacterium]|nr:tetratricopeptide repeat protein [Bacteroidales bacterium]HPE57499.1 tetratricopeptide repeat protein [Bacteroidales bacterium]HRX98250.1 tetratricopeptide repeat protein [Bacteroidales bacterium]
MKINPGVIILLVLFEIFFRISGVSATPAIYNIEDTLKILRNIELADSLYNEFEYDSSSVHAAIALQWARDFYGSELVKTNAELAIRGRVLLTRSLVTYAMTIRRIDINIAEDTLNCALQLIGGTGNLSEEALVYQGLGSINDRKGQSEKALQYFSKARDIFKNLGDKENYAGQLINIGLLQRYIGDYGESMENLMESLKISREIKDTLNLVESLLAMGFVYAFVERWNEALNCQREALSIYDMQNDLWGIARIHNDMGVTYMSAGKLDSALMEHRAALDIRLKTNDTYNTFASYLYIGDILSEQGDIIGAIESYEKGVPYGKNAGYKIMLVNAFVRLGGLYLKLNDVENAKKQFNNALALSIEFDDPTGNSQSNMGLAKINLTTKSYTKALAFVKAAEANLPGVPLNFRKEIYRDVVEVYAGLGDYKNAYLNSLKYAELNDTLAATENLEKITKLTNKLEFENKLALQDESHAKIMALKQAQINRERITRNIFLSGMIIAFIIVIVVFFRFIEKKKLNDKLNDTLANLRATQTQLVQAEKMASLGELTAGIAHEIQNPLNFVNNFSEVGRDLINELKEALENDDKEEVQAISDDLLQNLDKINQHGKRAEGIVKGMLQHSRTRTGEKEPVDINKLADEYLRLAYHGLRAKDKSFQSDFRLEADEQLPKVNIVAQDIGRVLLNLINNAFFSVSEKTKQSVIGYNPEVVVKTKKVNHQIEISVKDNGTGIPEEIRAKIFQPFFTTKPTGQGTGLGLSMSYDIITKGHGGKIWVESKVGEGSEFIITLTENK